MNNKDILVSGSVEVNSKNNLYIENIKKIIDNIFSIRVIILFLASSLSIANLVLIFINKLIVNINIGIIIEIINSFILMLFYIGILLLSCERKANRAAGFMADPVKRLVTRSLKYTP